MFPRQGGVALITAVLISAIITLMVFAMVEQQVVDARRASNMTQRYQAYMFAEWAEGWAKRILSQDAKSNSVDHKLEEWTQVVPPFEVDRGLIGGSIIDRNGCFNLNNLVKAGVAQNAELQRYKRLLLALEMDTGLADATVDWLDKDNQPTFPHGAESDYYARLEPPYAIANQTLVSSSELLAIKGYDMEIFTKLRPYVCALPKSSIVNINFSEIPVLMSMAPAVTSAVAEAIVQERDKPQQGLVSKKGFASIDDMLNGPSLNTLLTKTVKDQIKLRYGVSSNYFLLQTETSFDRSDMVVYSLLERSGTTIKTHFRAQGSY